MRCYDTRHTVAALRKVTGLSQGELAEIVGCSKRTIQAIEIGRLDLSEKLAVKISHETGVSMRWLLEGDYTKPPAMEFADKPYTKEIYEETRAAIVAGTNPNAIAINLASEFNVALKGVPMESMERFVEQTNSLLHPDMDYWLASILSSIFAAVKAGQARLAIYRLREFANALKKEFGQRFDGEFTDDASVVFEQGLQRLKMTALLVEKDRGAGTSTSTTRRKKQPTTTRDILHDSEIELGLKGFDPEPMWKELNHVGDRLRTRGLAGHNSTKRFLNQLIALRFFVQDVEQLSESLPASKDSKHEVGSTKMPVKRSTRKSSA